MKLKIVTALSLALLVPGSVLAVKTKEMIAEELIKKYEKKEKGVTAEIVAEAVLNAKSYKHLNDLVDKLEKKDAQFKTALQTVKGIALGKQYPEIKVMIDAAAAKGGGASKADLDKALADLQQAQADLGLAQAAKTAAENAKTITQTEKTQLEQQLQQVQQQLAAKEDEILELKAAADLPAAQQKVKDLIFGYKTDIQNNIIGVAQANIALTDANELSDAAKAENQGIVAAANAILGAFKTDVEINAATAKTMKDMNPDADTANKIADLKARLAAAKAKEKKPTGGAPTPPPTPAEDTALKKAVTDAVAANNKAGAQAALDAYKKAWEKQPVVAARTQWTNDQQAAIDKIGAGAPKTVQELLVAAATVAEADKPALIAEMTAAAKKATGKDQTDLEEKIAELQGF